MKAKAYQLPALKKELTSTFLGALVYGPDFGVVSDIAETIAGYIVPDLKDDFTVIKITPSKIKEKPSLVLDEANALSLMGGRRVIWIKEADNACADIILTLADQIKTDSFILITADNLTKTSALRLAGETHPRFLTLACYADEERDIQNTILMTLKEKGYQPTPNALILLKERLNDNRVATKNELEKLMTYMGNQKTIEASDVLAISTPSSTTSYDTLCMAVGSGNQKEVDAAYQLLLATGESPVTITRLLIMYFNRLLLGITALSKGDSLESATKKVLRPAQFKLEAATKYQLSIWKKEWIIKALNILGDTEKQTKTTAMPAELIVARTLITLTNVAAKARR